MRVPGDLLSFLRKEDMFFIATHVSPDGDALGSSIALSMALETLGKKTVVYDSDKVPDLYRFLPGQERFTDSIPESVKQNGQISNLVLVDCNEPERADLEKVRFTHSTVIDHHETEREFGNIKWIEPHSPATGIMIFYLIKELGVKITKEIAASLYSAIAIDTGTFRYNNTTPEALLIASDLINAGADPALIAQNLYETWSENRFRLLLKVLSTLEIRGDVSIVVITQGMFKDTGTTAADTEHFSSFPRMLKSTKISALFREIEHNYYKASLRSKGETNVARIAEVFGGGGHRNAAGYKIRADIQTTKESLLKAIRELP